MVGRSHDLPVLSRFARSDREAPLSDTSNALIHNDIHCNKKDIYLSFKSLWICIVHHALCIDQKSIDPDGRDMTEFAALCSPRHR